MDSPRALEAIGEVKFYGLAGRRPEDVAPGWVDGTIAAAKKLLQHKYEYLGLGEIDLGKRINWNREYKRGIDTPLLFGPWMDYRDTESYGDFKYFWELPHVHFLGRKPYEEIPFYGKTFDVAMMPWNRNKWIEYCNPVKTKEYLALGKPIVSVYYPEIEPYSDVVYVARDYDGFVSCIGQAIEEDDPAKVRERR
jgi:hypothetical protein